MLDLYSYFKSQLPIGNIKNVYRCSGFLNLEEVIKSSQTKPPYLIVVETPPIGLRITDTPADIEAHSFYVVQRALLNDDASRAKAKSDAFSIGRSLIFQMRDDEIGLIEDDIVQTYPVGPLPKQGFGYCFNPNIDANG